MIYLVLLCGAADRPVQALNGRTPLEYARTICLDELAARGTVGMITVIDSRIPPESDSAVMAFLGYDPCVYYTGRGPLEALGAGFWDGKRSCVGFRINFASLNRETDQLDRRTARDLDDEELQAIVGEIREVVSLDRHPDLSFEIAGFGRHRGVVCFKSASTALSGTVSNTDPGFDRVGPFGVPRENGRTNRPEKCRPLDDTEAAAQTALAVNEFTELTSMVMAQSRINRTRVSFGKLPANVLLFRDGGHTLPSLPRFADHSGLTVSLYGQIPAEHALCDLMGGTFVDARPRAGQRRLEFYRDLATELSESPSDLVIVHLKGPDEPGHDDKPFAKVAAIEEIDQFFLSELAGRMAPGDICVVTCDHATPCETGLHTADPVPALVFGTAIPADQCSQFNEVAARSGALPVARATDLLSFVMSTALERC